MIGILTVRFPTMTHRGNSGQRLKRRRSHARAGLMVCVVVGLLVTQGVFLLPGDMKASLGMKITVVAAPWLLGALYLYVLVSTYRDRGTAT